jgi:hypothetical protein
MPQTNVDHLQRPATEHNKNRFYVLKNYQNPQKVPRKVVAQFVLARLQKCIEKSKRQEIANLLPFERVSKFTCFSLTK